MRQHDHHPTGKLHPWIFRILMGFIGGWLIITYSFFLNTNGGGRAYGAIIALIVSVFGLVVLLIPTSIRRIALNHPIGRNIAPSALSLRDWLNGELVVWDHKIKGRDAAIAILLPGVAAMVGGVALAIVFHLVTP